jgi:hypothetical protein
VTDDDTYVHEPGGVTDDASSRAEQTDTGAQDEYPRNTADPASAEFDWRGWVLVGVVVFAFLVVPGALYALPTARSAVAGIGLSLRDTYLVLPLLPAFLLGVVAVWSAVRSRS